MKYSQELQQESGTTSLASRTLIRVTEIWVPNRDFSALELHDGVYGDLDLFRGFSEKISFAYGEGLPGLAWERGRPVVLKYLEGTVFKRTPEAHEAGLTSAIAFPIFTGEFLRAVIVFLCGDTAELSGAIEVWERAESGELELADGFYGDLKKFESLSRSLQFAIGRGLPGVVWEKRFPHLLPDVAASSSFLRARYAAEVGIREGVGIPFFSAGGLDTVVTFLSSKSTPIARRFELWRPSGDRSHLVLESAISQDSDSDSDSESGPGLGGAAAESRVIRRGEGPIGGCWRSGIPAVAEGADAGGYGSLLAIPVIEGGRLNSVVACYR